MAAAVGVVLYVGSNADDADDDRAAQAQLVMAPRDLVFALQDEGSVAAVTALGMGDVVDLPVDDNAEARSRTDAAITDFEAVVASAEVYRGALDAVEDLDGLRQEIDGPAEPGGFSYAREIRGRYGEVVAAVLDAHTRFVDTIGDPELRRGADLFGGGLRQLETAWLLLGEIPDQASWSTPEGITRMSELFGELLQGGAFVMEQASGDHAGAARQLDAELEAARSEELLTQVLETGQGDIIALSQSLAQTSRAWHSFLGEIEATLTRPA